MLEYMIPTAVLSFAEENKKMHHSGIKEFEGNLNSFKCKDYK